MKNRLTWLLLAVIAFDFAVTILGQPSRYWTNPASANEGNRLFAWFMVRGPVAYAGLILAYMTGVAVLVRMLPRQTAIITGLVFLLAHYFAGSTWLTFHFHLGMVGPVAYAVVLSMALLSILQSGGPGGFDCLTAKRDSESGS